MTYCLGILLREGLVLASDSRSNAGVDQVTHACKLTVLPTAHGSVAMILSAGNLATTQAVIGSLRKQAGAGETGDVCKARTLFDVAAVVGSTLRAVVERDGRYVAPYGDASASFLVAGQMAGEPHRLFQIYNAGNFVEATERSSFLQIGETKYGKPILIRALSYETGLEEATKLALLSFDATLRSNISVGMPVDLVSYRANSFAVDSVRTFEPHDPYWTALSEAYGAGIVELVGRLPAPSLSDGDNGPAPRALVGADHPD